MESIKKAKIEENPVESFTREIPLPDELKELFPYLEKTIIDDTQEKAKELMLRFLEIKNFYLQKDFQDSKIKQILLKNIFDFEERFLEVLSSPIVHIHNFGDHNLYRELRKGLPKYTLEILEKQRIRLNNIGFIFPATESSILFLEMIENKNILTEDLIICFKDLQRELNKILDLIDTDKDQAFNITYGEISFEQKIDFVQKVSETLIKHLDELINIQNKYKNVIM